MKKLRIFVFFGLVHLLVGFHHFFQPIRLHPFRSATFNAHLRFLFENQSALFDVLGRPTTISFSFNFNDFVKNDIHLSKEFSFKKFSKFWTSKSKFQIQAPRRPWCLNCRGRDQNFQTSQLFPVFFKTKKSLIAREARSLEVRKWLDSANSANSVFFP